MLLGDELRGLHLPGGGLLALGVAVGEVVESLPLAGSPLADLLDGLQVLHDVHLAVEEPVGRSGSEDLVEAHIDHFTLGAVIGRSGREVLALFGLSRVAHFDHGLLKLLHEVRIHQIAFEFHVVDNQFHYSVVLLWSVL